MISNQFQSIKKENITISNLKLKTLITVQNNLNHWILELQYRSFISREGFLLANNRPIEPSVTPIEASERLIAAVKIINSIYASYR